MDTKQIYLVSDSLALNDCILKTIEYSVHEAATKKYIRLWTIN